MGDESKQNEIERGNRDPLHAPRKPSTARRVENEVAETAQMPSNGEADHRADEERRPRHR